MQSVASIRTPAHIVEAIVMNEESTGRKGAFIESAISTLPNASPRNRRGPHTLPLPTHWSNDQNSIRGPPASRHRSNPYRGKSAAVTLALCASGIIFSLCLQNVILERIYREKACTDLGLLLVASCVYSSVSFVAYQVLREPPHTTPSTHMLSLSMLTFVASWTSIFCLHYVPFPVRVLIKSSKALPIMVAGTIMGKRYPRRKYLFVLVMSMGIATYTFFGNARSSSTYNAEMLSLIFGCFLLLVSLSADGLTGAYQDKFIAIYGVGPFQLLHGIHSWRMLLTFGAITASGEVGTVINDIQRSFGLLLLYACTGVVGQMLVFYILAGFGALTASIIGTARKVLTVVGSIIVFHHSISPLQQMGLALALVGLILVTFYSSPSKPQREEKQAPFSAKQVDTQKRHSIVDLSVEAEEQGPLLPYRKETSHEERRP